MRLEALKVVVEQKISTTIRQQTKRTTEDTDRQYQILLAEQPLRLKLAE